MKNHGTTDKVLIVADEHPYSLTDDELISIEEDISDIKRPFDCDMHNYFDFQEPEFEAVPWLSHHHIIEDEGVS